MDAGKLVYLGLGSNLGEREFTLRRALDLLIAPDLRLTKVSSIYETAPMYDTAQGAFLNMAVEARTTLFPRQLLARCRKVELALGRRRTRVNGPRTIDIDVLLYAQNVITTRELTVPHPGLPERRFVLEPLAEIAPDLRHPQTRRTMRELLREVVGQRVERFTH